VPILNGQNVASVTMTVNPVNDAPSFMKGSNLTVSHKDGAQTVEGWATSLSPGPANESGQSLSFLVSADPLERFATQPALSPGGTLTYSPKPGANGVATVTVRLQDSGGTANGGIDTSASQTFTIEVLGDSLAPTTAAVTDPSLPNGENGWFTQDVTVTMTAADDEGGVGVAGVRYALDDGEWQQVAAPAQATLAMEGAHALKYRSLDLAGNEEAERTLAIKIDKTAPTTEIGFGRHWPVDDPDALSYVQIRVTDPASGLREIDHRSTDATGNYVTPPIEQTQDIDGQWVEGISAVSPEGQGETRPTRTIFVKAGAGPSTLTFRVRDAAGNLLNDPNLGIQEMDFLERDRSQSRTFDGVGQERSRFSILSKQGALRNVQLQVNGETVSVGEVKAGAVQVVDLRSRLMNRTDNVVSVTAKGDAGTQALALVSSATLTNVEAASPDMALQRGDLNKDRTLNVADVVSLLHLAARLQTATPSARLLGDVNLDGRVNVSDAVFLLRKVIRR
jgi:hypothetical protein